MRIFRKLRQMLDVNADSITDGQVLAWNDATEKFIPADASAGGSGAPTNATFITQTHHASLSDEQALEDLASGLVKNTTGTGVLSIAAAGTDYYAPGATDVAVADGGTGASDAPTARTNLGLVIGTDVVAKSVFDDHSARHENGGADELSVAGLSGELADPQPTNATKVDSGVATDGQILTADGAGGAGWEDAPAGGAVDAADVTFTPAGTIAASDAQAAVEEVATDAASALSTHAADTTSVHGITDTSALALTANVPSNATFNDHSARHEDGGADEISIQGLSGTPTELTNHLNDTADAHDASAISVLDTAANFTGTDVEAVLAELAALGSGGSWGTYTPALTASTTNPNLGSTGTASGLYFQLGKMVLFVAEFKFNGSGVSVGSGTFAISLPVAADSSMSSYLFFPGHVTSVDDSAATTQVGTAIWATSTTINMLRHGTTQFYSSSVPQGWAAGDRLSVFGFFRAA